MKGVSYSRFGGSEVLEYGELPEPKLSQNAVIVRVKAAAINPADIALQAGFGEDLMETWFPVVPGWDLSGIVERVGAGVIEFQPGSSYTPRHLSAQLRRVRPPRALPPPRRLGGPAGRSGGSAAGCR